MDEVGVELAEGAQAVNTNAIITTPMMMDESDLFLIFTSPQNL
jgi:hypothetical protein